ncbi:hypothetical protein ACQQ2N_11100 [Dokdonella sp. MW10]|uniref:hypothetical protein n=1 Tax=Dokdonella sp. MW10 TaxID=2992926 RepID=UPI003F7F01DF
MSSEGRHRPQLVVGLATAFMCALAAGAVWCVAQLYLRMDLVVLALPTGALVAWALRNHGFARTLSGSAVAAALTLLACAYASYLLAAAKVATFLGLPMRSTLLAIGPEMAAAVSWADMTGFHIGTIVLAAVLSAWLVWRSR